MTIDYLEGCLTEEEKQEIQSVSSDIYIHFLVEKPGMSYAALDDLYGHIVIWLTSREVQAFINAVELLSIFCKIVKKIREYSNNKSIVRIDSEMKIIVHKKNTIIQVDNIMILKPENLNNLSSENEYLHLALSAIANGKLPKNKDIVISYDGEPHFETIEQYAERKNKK